MNIVIKTSDRPNKKYVAVINNKKTYILAIADIQTIQNIRTPKEKNISIKT